MTRARIFRHAMRQLARRKRASVLLVVGVIFAINGWVMWDTADLIARAPTVSKSYAAHDDVMPLATWGWVFIVVGTTSAVAGFVARLPAWIGFAGLQLLATFWGLLFVASYLQTDYSRALIGLTQWALVAALLAITSGWEDPPAHPVRGGRHG